MEFTINNLNYNADLGVFPKIKFETSISSRDPNNIEMNATLLTLNIKLSYNGQTISLADPITTAENIGGGGIIQTNSFYFNLDREKLRAIELARSDDILFYLNFDFLYTFTTNEKQTLGNYRQKLIAHPLKLSQKEWIQMLNKMGFYDAWIIEIPRPKIDGSNNVIENIEKASSAMNSHRYDECMGHLRVAWNLFKTTLELKWNDMAAFIDLGSLGEKDRETKSKRIQDIKDKVIYFVQIGVHREFYKVNPEDAILAYYQTVAMISYLSQIIKKIELQKL